MNNTIKNYKLPAFPLMVRNFLASRAMRWASTILIILSFYPCDNMPWKDLFNRTFLIIFSIEICLRFISYIFIEFKEVSARRAELVFLLIDIVALASFLPETMLFMETRYLRLFRLIRLFKLLRNFSNTFKEIHVIIKAKSLSRQLRILVMTIIIIAFTGSFVLILYVPDADGTLPGLSAGSIVKGAWWSIRQMADPGNMADFNEVRNFQHGILSFALMVSGVLVLSFIIGIGSEVIRSLIEMTRNKPIDLVNHYLLCGWEPQSSVLVKQLYAYLHDNNDVKSFKFALLDKDDSERNVLLSLSGTGSSNMPGQGGRLAFGGPADTFNEDKTEINFSEKIVPGSNFFVRTGTAGVNTDLDIVSAGTSRAIVVLPRDKQAGDHEIIAEIMNVCAYLDMLCTPEWFRHLSLLYPGIPFKRPVVYAVTNNPESCELAVTAGSDYAVSKFDFTSKFLSQLILNPWIVDIFKELFSWEGSEIYTLDLTVSLKEHAGEKIDMSLLAETFLSKGIILLGIVRRRLKPGYTQNNLCDDFCETPYERDMQFISSLNYSAYYLLEHPENIGFSDNTASCAAASCTAASRAAASNAMASSAKNKNYLPDFDSKKCIILELVYLAENRDEKKVLKGLRKSFYPKAGRVNDLPGLSIFSGFNKESVNQVSEEEQLIRNALSGSCDQVNFMIDSTKNTMKVLKNVLVLGWNKGVPSLITHLKSFLKNLRVTIIMDKELTPELQKECINMIKRSARKKSLSIFGKTMRKMGKTGSGHSEKCRQIFAHATSGIPVIEFIKADYTSATDMVLAPDLDIKNQDYIILVPEFEDSENPDGRVFLGILNLMTLAEQGFISFKETLRIVAEIADVNQGALMDRIVEQYQKRHDKTVFTSNSSDMIEIRKKDWLNIVPSENFFNRYMASILFNPQMKRIFDRLFTDKDEEIYILKPAYKEDQPFDFIDFKIHGTFEKLYLQLLEYSIILIGILSAETGKIIINPLAEKRDFMVNKKDHFVVICNKNNSVKQKYGLC